MKSPLLTIIVPIYNSAPFLRKCLDSILAQSLKNFELICVNDGSTDGSSDILEEYGAKDSRISIITKSNGGLVSARKAGVAAATGKYIGFVDADDWIESKMYERLYDAANQVEADIVTSGYIQEGNYISVSIDNVESGVYKNDRISDLRENIIFNLQKRDKGVIASLCTKIFDATILKKVILEIPDNITMSEDKMTSLTFMLHAKCAVIIHEAYYHYVMHPSSMTHSKDAQYLIRLNCVFQYLRSLYLHPNFTKKMRVQAELYVTQYLIKGINSNLGFENSNLLWIDPYWLGLLPKNSKIVLYGGGALGYKYRQQILAAKKFHFIGCVDFNHERTTRPDFLVGSPETLLEMTYDFLVITIKNYDFAMEIKGKLMEKGIPGEKICWFEQKEIFWRFAQADGLLD